MDQLPLLLSRLLDLYSRLLSDEVRRVECCLDYDLETAETLRISEERLAEDIRDLHGRIRELTGTRSLGEVLADDDAPSGDLRSHLGVLRRMVREVQLMVDRHRRFIFNSLSFSQALLPALLGGENGRYDGDGFLQAGRNRVAGRGVRA